LAAETFSSWTAAQRRDALRRIKTDLGLSGRAFADALGIHETSLSKIWAARLPVTDRTLRAAFALLDAASFERLVTPARLARKVNARIVGETSVDGQNRPLMDT
jgi:transcriptional regulator with XRE-family HTH domain